MAGKPNPAVRLFVIPEGDAIRVSIILERQLNGGPLAVTTHDELCATVGDVRKVVTEAIHAAGIYPD